MSLALRVSLPSLPPELLRMIAPDPHSWVHIPISDPKPQEQLWLVIKLKWDIDGEPDPLMDEDIITLRSLSQTCRYLRAFVLPVLWEVVHVDSVNELGRIRETLRVSPHIARHIKSFCILWQLSDNEDNLENYPEDQGTLLDFAFRHRMQAWLDFAQQHGCEIKRDKIYGWFFKYQGRLIERPSSGASGPDGKGEDRLIRTPAHFNECIAEIVSQLSSLETFGWCTKVTPMPAGVLHALLEIETLRSLHVDMKRPGRNEFHNVPLWELTSGLATLSLSLGEDRDFQDAVTEGEQTEDILTSFELPQQPPAYRDYRARGALRYAVAARAIVSAARGGHLRHLDIDYDGADHGFGEMTLYNDNIEGPFAVRTLLPFWVGIDSWSREAWRSEALFGWPGAAQSLRPLLAHASLWLGSITPTIPRDDRHLTRQNIQMLPTYFKQEGARLRDAFKRECRQPRHPCPIEQYLPWLEDAELAEQVAGAWNAVVERGGADKVVCQCKRCRAM